MLYANKQRVTGSWSLCRRSVAVLDMGSSMRALLIPEKLNVHADTLSCQVADSSERSMLETNFHAVFQLRHYPAVNLFATAVLRKILIFCWGGENDPECGRCCPVPHIVLNWWNTDLDGAQHWTFWSPKMGLSSKLRTYCPCVFFLRFWTFNCLAWHHLHKEPWLHPHRGLTECHDAEHVLILLLLWFYNSLIHWESLLMPVWCMG